MPEKKNEVSLLIPTLNAGKLWIEVLESISNQNYPIGRKIVVDSGSNDDTVKLAIEHRFEVIKITKEEFNHGTTRQLLADRTESDICVFLTQDAILSTENSLRRLVEAFDDLDVALAYGRQIPHDNAKPLEVHARLFNYPEGSIVRSFQDKDRLGFKVFFCSNSFAAYRRIVLKNIGGFPSESIMGEDALVAAKMLIAGYKIAYVADAKVKHSHNYSFKEEFKRYFDTRVFHEQNQWLIDQYGKPTGEGLKYVKSVMKFMAINSPISMISTINLILAKWLGYSLGNFYRNMPVTLLKSLSMHKSYWR
ncbi:MAG: Rhamnosyltransferase [Mucilaginibacter sp.]|nr:Rhamnosyltransferase [Mucilaginibacter sp.]